MILLLDKEVGNGKLEKMLLLPKIKQFMQKSKEL